MLHCSRREGLPKCVMATADEIREQIAARRREVQQAVQEKERAQQEFNEACVRQQLRRELDDVNALLVLHRDEIVDIRDDKRLVDQDEWGPHLRRNQNPAQEEPEDVRYTDAMRHGEVSQGVVDCAGDVISGEIEWSIRGFSWLEDTLQQNSQKAIKSPSINVGSHRFSLRYCPRGSICGDAHGQRGSLAIFHHYHANYNGVTFRYQILIKSKERGYIQWGNSGNVCTNQAVDDMLFGPDVCKPPATPSGIFKMTHDQLMQSEWVIDDALTAKLNVEVRPKVRYSEKDCRREVNAIVLPPSSLNDNLLLLLDSAAASDVTFKVQGDVIKAHSQILSACSEVLQRQFSCGMQESISKEVTIEDCEPLVFKAFLRYLYSDSFAAMENFVASNTSSPSVAAGAASANAPKMTLSILQQLLAVSHKYQITRLQLWCELKLCELISVEEACSVLKQAHLHEAKQLKERCLDFIAENMSEVIKTEAFASLTQKWPQIGLMITCRVARISDGNAAAAMNMHESTRKRKRED